MSNNDNQILKSNLSTLLKRFANTSVVDKFGDTLQSNNVFTIEVEKISNNRYLKNVEVDEKAITSVIKDIKYHGIINPILVRTVAESKYELITGRTRLICAKRLKLKNVPCMIQNFSDEDMLLYMLFSYKMDKTKSVVEMANICNVLCKKFHYTQATIADLLDISRAQVTNLIRILNLPKKLQRDVGKGRLTYGHARAIAVLNEEQMLEVASMIYEKKLSVRDTEYLVNEMRSHHKYEDILTNFKKRNNLEAKINGKQLIINLYANMQMFHQILFSSKFYCGFFAIN